MTLWFIKPELLSKLEFENSTDGYRVRAHPSDKFRKALPEQVIKKLIILHLHSHYHYPLERLIQEYPVQMGISKKYADIAIVNDQKQVITLIEVKQTINNDSAAQLHSYMHATGARYGAVISIYDRKIFKREYSGTITEISRLPIFENKGGSIVEDKNDEGQSASISNSKLLMDSLGITGLISLENKSFELCIKGQCIRLSNNDLLSYRKLRTIALGNNILLPSNISKSAWDDLLELLFMNVTQETDINNDADEHVTTNILNDIILADELMTKLGITGLVKSGNTKAIIKINGKNLEVSISDLSSYNKIKKKALELGFVLESSVNKSQWDEILRILFDRVIVLENEPEPEAVFIQHLKTFCKNYSRTNDKTDVLAGRPWADENTGFTWFRSQDLMKYCGQQNFKHFKEKETWGIYRRNGAKHTTFMLKGRCVACWGVPTCSLQTEAEKT